jgi:hypothetical protein
MSKSIYYKRTHDYPNGWWTKGKLYKITYRCGKARLTDDEGSYMFIEECNLTYLRQNFQKV